MVELFLQFLKTVDVRFNSKVQSLEKWILEDDRTLISGSEHSIIDRVFTTEMLKILGYQLSDFSYNEHGGKDGNIPDFRIEIDNETYFCIEDKSLDINIAPNAIFSSIENQVNRYLSISGTVILTNGKRILVFGRRNSQPSLEIDIDIEAMLRGDSLLIEDHRDALAYFFERFSKKAVTDRLADIREYAVDEETWKAEALDISSNLEGFIAKSQPILGSLKTEVSSQVYSNILRYREYHYRVAEVKKTFVAGYDDYLGVLDDLIGHGASDFIREHSLDFENLKDKIAISMKHRRLLDHQKSAAKKVISGLAVASREAHILRWQFDQSIQIAESLKTWAERNRLFGEDDSALFMSHLCSGTESEECRDNLRQFSAEVAYTFFMRFFIIRVIEDKEILRSRGIRRVLTDGGLETWLKVLDIRMKTENTVIRGRELMEEANMLAVEVFQDFEEKFSYYNWFVPRDYSIIRMIRLFGEYNFRDLRKDIIGYTWERFKIAKERHKQGQYLTPKEIVDKMLDQLEYLPNNSAIVGQRIIDPSCGSGTFLIEAISRLRASIFSGEVDEAEEKARRIRFIEKVQSNIYGFEIDSFSWYLATMNVYLSIIDDISWLIERKTDVRIEHINLYHTDALNNYPFVNEDDLVEPAFDEDGKIKTDLKGKFTYVVGNPPYANANSEDQIVTDAVAKNPFYRGWFEGIINIYVPFFRVAHYLLMDSGKMSFIHPITLWADGQTQAARIMLKNSFSPLHFYRFYAHQKSAVFKDVIQDVGITTLAKNAFSPTAEVHVGGTWNLESMKNADELMGFAFGSDVFAHDKIRVYPFQEIYKIEDMAKQLPYTLLDLLEAMGHDREEIEGSFSSTSGKRQTYYNGVVHATQIWKKHSLHISERDESAITEKMPLYKGGSTYYFSPFPSVPQEFQTTDKGVKFRYIKVPTASESLEVHKKLKRIWSQHEELWYIAQAQMFDNNEYRGIKPIVEHWSNTQKHILPHSLYVFEVGSKDQALILTAFLTSSIVQMLFGLSMTNQNLTKTAVLSIPVPSLQIPLSLLKFAQEAYFIAGVYLSYLERYNVFSKSNSGIVDILDKKWTCVQIEKIIKIFGFEIWLKQHSTSFQTVQDYIDAGLITTNKIIIKTAEERYNKIEFLESGDIAVNEILKWLKISYGTQDISPMSISMPALIQKNVKVDEYRAFIDEIVNLGIMFAQKIKEIDTIAMQWYGLEDYANAIERGLPWVKS